MLRRLPLSLDCHSSAFVDEAFNGRGKKNESPKYRIIDKFVVEAIIYFEIDHKIMR